MRGSVRSNEKGIGRGDMKGECKIGRDGSDTGGMACLLKQGASAEDEWHERRPA